MKTLLVSDILIHVRKMASSATVIIKDRTTTYVLREMNIDNMYRTVTPN